MSILARFLRDRGIVTERQIQEAVQHQVLYGGRLGTSLYELGFITEERLDEALARIHGVPPLRFDPRELTAETVTLVPKGLVERHKVFPYRLRGKTLFLLMVDPNDHKAMAEVGFRLGYIVRPLVVPEFRMIQLLHDYYGVDERWRYTDTHHAPSGRIEPMDVEAATALLDRATTRDEIVDAAIALCLHYFKRVIFFIVRQPWVLGWNGAGEGMDRHLAESLRIPLDQPSVFQSVAQERTVFIGRLAAGPENEKFLKAIAKRPQTTAAVFPIAVRGRVVNLIYGDAGAGGGVRAEVGGLLVHAQHVTRAYLRIIRRRIAETRRAMHEPLPEGQQRSGGIE
jgi:hypothetical protein